MYSNTAPGGRPNWSLAEAERYWTSAPMYSSSTPAERSMCVLQGFSCPISISSQGTSNELMLRWHISIFVLH